MRFTLVIHILGGSLALVSGFLALYVIKGATLHRRAGLVFVWSMLAMAIAGGLIAIARRVAIDINLPGALMSIVLVTTGFTTVRPPSLASRIADPIATVLALGVGAICLVFGVEAVASGGSRGEMPAFPYLLFGIVGTMAGLGDLRRIGTPPLKGTRRLTRHLWRMSFALLIAAMSFFIGQAKVFPEPIRIMPLLALPVLAVLVTMLYWLWRVRVRHTLRGLVTRELQAAWSERTLPLRSSNGDGVVGARETFDLPARPSRA